MKRQIKVVILMRDPFKEAYIRDLLKREPNISFCDTSSLDADVFIVESSLLNPTEQKVLQALAELGTIDEVSKHLHYHRSTVKRKPSRIYKKLKVKSAPQAIAIGVKLKLIKAG